MRISRKLPVVMVALALFAAAVTGVLAYSKAGSEMVEAAEDKLMALLQAREANLSAYLDSVRQDVSIVANVRTVPDALMEFSFGYNTLDDPAAYLHRIYIDENPYEAGQRARLDFADDDTDYADIHERYHPWFRQILETKGFRDIYLVDMEGHVLYSVRKERDFAVDLTTDDWQGTGLGMVYAQLADSPEPGRQVMTDFLAYDPIGGEAAGFMGETVFFEGIQHMGYLIFQMPIDRISEVAGSAIGLGESGDAYIIGRDRVMRTQSRLADTPTILRQRVETAAARRALDGETGMLTQTSHRGVETVTAYAPLSFMGVDWAIITETAVDEVMRPVHDMRTFMLLGGLGIFIVVVVVGAFVARGVSAPIGAMTTAMSRLAEGDKTIEVPGLSRKDEVGDMARAVQVFKENAARMEALQAEQEEAERRAARQRTEDMAKLADAFEARIMGVVDNVSASAESMRNTAQGMAGNAEQTSKQATMVAAASEEAATNVQTVASAAEELSASISEISRQVAQSNSVSRSAVEEAEATNERVQGLAEAADRIGEVVTLISDIAEQTNLLALNATIEAARAGDAGKGFAVVANEVKNLASQTAKATEEISSQISDVQAATHEAVQAIGRIRSTIGEINEIASAIAAAVEEQGAATQEIARNVQQAAEGTGEVSSNIAGVTQAAGETGDAAGIVLESARGLSEEAVTLREEVNRFLKEVRGA